MARARDARDLLETFQPGDRASGQIIIRTYQNEVVRGSFLLTGDGARANRLARIAFLDLFRALSRGGTTDDPRETLLGAQVRHWLTGDHRSSQLDDAAAPSLADMQLAGDSAHRFDGDTERSRVLAALGRLDQRVCAALVLREFHLLEEEAVCRILDTNPFDLRRRIQPARAKVQEEVSGGLDRSARDLLVDAASAAPRSNLWTELAGPLEDLEREEQERRQRYTYVAAAFVGLALILAAIWLFDVFPAGDDDTTSVAPEAVSTPTLAPPPTPAPTPTPIPDIASLDLPQADIPARFLIQSATADRGEIGLSDPSSGQYERLLDAGRLPYISPDGRWLIAFRFNTDGATQTLAAIDSSTGDRRWELPIADIPSSVAMTTETIYLLIRSEEHSALVALDLETGDEVGRSSDFVEDLPTAYSSVLQASLDGRQLYLAIESPGNRVPSEQRMLARFRLPEMTLTSVNRSTDVAHSNEFDGFSFYDARLTPDGEYLYAISEDAVRFRNADVSGSVDIDLPFSAPAPGTEDDLRWSSSNDGRYLYVIALARREAAIVDLLGRRLTRSFPIDLGEYDEFGRTSALAPIQGAPGTLLGVNRATVALSADGSRLYLASGLSNYTGGVSADASLIWVIDLATWRIVDRWEVSGLVTDLALMGNALYVSTFYTYINQDPQATVSPFWLVAFDSRTGERLAGNENTGRPEWAERFWLIGLADWYRAAYGRAPMVNGAAWEDAEVATTLPRLEITPSSDTVPAGGAFDIEVRVIDPETGEHLPSTRPGIRFDPAASVAMRLRHEDGEAADIFLIPASGEPGVYKASATSEQTGYWSVELTVTALDGSTWSFWAPRAFEVVPSFEATDGQRYILTVETEPAEPDVGADVVVRARFVEISTGRTLPFAERLVRGAPEELRLSFVLPDAGFTSAEVARTKDGTYEGVVSFRSPGVWPVEISFEFDDGESVRVGGGQIAVNWD